MSLGQSAAARKVYLEGLRAKYEAGNKAALIWAVRFCHSEHIVAPDWVMLAFFKATNRWLTMEVKTLDEAFDLVYPKGKHFNAARKRRAYQLDVYYRVIELHRAGAPLDDDLYERVGREFYIGKTLTKEYYAGGKAVIDAMPRERGPISQLLKPSKKRSRCRSND